MDENNLGLSNFVSVELGILHLLFMEILLKVADGGLREDQKKIIIKEKMEKFIKDLIRDYENSFHSESH